MQESACNAEDPSSIPGSGRSSRDEKDNPLQYSCLENPMDRGAWRATVHGITRVGHDLATKPQSVFLPSFYSFFPFILSVFLSWWWQVSDGLFVNQKTPTENATENILFLKSFQILMNQSQKCSLCPFYFGMGHKELKLLEK